MSRQPKVNPCDTALDVARHHGHAGLECNPCGAGSTWEQCLFACVESSLGKQRDEVAFRRKPNCHSCRRGVNTTSISWYNLTRLEDPTQGRMFTILGATTIQCTTRGIANAMNDGSSGQR